MALKPTLGQMMSVLKTVDLKNDPTHTLKILESVTLGAGHLGLPPGFTNNTSKHFASIVETFHGWPSAKVATKFSSRSLFVALGR